MLTKSNVYLSFHPQIAIRRAHNAIYNTLNRILEKIRNQFINVVLQSLPGIRGNKYQVS